MKKLPLVIAVAGVAALVAHRMSRESRSRGSGFVAMRNRMMRRMMASMPEDSPPRLVMSVLPRLQAQNQEILALLAEQNDLLRRISAKQEEK